MGFVHNGNPSVHPPIPDSTSDADGCGHSHVCTRWTRTMDLRMKSTLRPWTSCGSGVLIVLWVQHCRSLWSLPWVSPHESKLHLGFVSPGSTAATHLDLLLFWVGVPQRSTSVLTRLHPMGACGCLLDLERIRSLRPGPLSATGLDS